MKPPEFQLERNNCFPWPTDPTLDNAGQQMVGLQGPKGVLLIHVQLAVRRDPRSIFCEGASYSEPCRAAWGCSVSGAGHRVLPADLHAAGHCASHPVTLPGVTDFVLRSPSPYLQNLSEGFCRRWRHATPSALPSCRTSRHGWQVGWSGRTFYLRNTCWLFPSILISFLLPDITSNRICSTILQRTEGWSTTLLFSTTFAAVFGDGCEHFLSPGTRSLPLSPRPFKNYTATQWCPLMTSTPSAAPSPMSCVFILLKICLIQPSFASFPIKTSCIFLALISLIFKTVTMNISTHHPIPINPFWNTLKKWSLLSRTSGCLWSKSGYTKNQGL